MAQFILSKSDMLEAYNKIKELGVNVSYSHKTNEEVGELMEKETNCIFNIHSFKSLDRVKDKSRVWYFPLALSKQNYFNLFEKGVSKFVVDNKTDLNRLIEAAKEKEIKIELLLRMKLKENTIMTGKYYVFGMGSKEVNQLLPELAENQSLSKIGIHVHRKSQNVSEWSLVEDVANAITDENKKLIDIVDIGGGIPTAYKNTNDKAIDRIYQKIRELVEFVQSNFKSGVEVIAEPGRAIAAPCVKLKTKILSVDENAVTVDSSVYNTAIDTVLVGIKLLVENELENCTQYDKQFLIRGSTPCSMDILRYRVYLNEPKTGDYIYFLNAGAYNYHSDFCDLEKIETIIVD